MEGDLASFVQRSRAVLDESPELSARTTDLRITLPFLETLGWDVHGTDVVGEYAVADDGGETELDYALQVGGRPAVFVVTTGVGESMSTRDRDRLEAAMAAADVEWGLATNGDVFTFLADAGDGPREVTCQLDDLPEKRSVVARYTREAARRRYERRREDLRESAADTLDADRGSVTGAVESALVDADVPDPVAEELRETAATVVDGVVDALADGDHPTEGVAGVSAGDGSVHHEDGSGEPARSRSEADGAGTNGSVGGAETAENDGDEASPDADGDDGEESAAAATADPEPEASNQAARVGAASTPASDGRDDREYVVRFFDGGSSVGAIGHATSAGALVQAVEYLVANHALDGSLDLPWGPTDDRAVIHHDPVHPDGTEMVEAAQLANGYFVCTTIPPEAIREVIEELADTAGLRVMFQGDW